MKYFYLTLFIFILVFNFNSFSQNQWELSDKLLYKDTDTEVFEIKYLGNGVCILTGVLSGSLCVIYKSKDYGKTWENTYNEYFEFNSDTLPSPFSLKSTSIVSEDAIFALYDDFPAIKRFYYNSKEQDTFKITNMNIPTNIKMFDENFGVITNQGFLYITKNGWVNYDSVYPEGLIRGLNIKKNKSISFLTKYNDSTFYVEYSNNVWKYNFVDKNYLPLHQFFINDLVGWVFSQKPIGKGDFQYNVIHKSTDGGITWLKQLDTSFSNSTNVKAIKFKDEKIGIAIAAPNYIYETIDGGESWRISKFNSPNGNNGQLLYKIEFVEDMIFIGTDGSGIWRRPIFPKTDVEQFEKVNITFPNPFQNSFTIQDTEIAKGKYLLKIISQTGAELISEKIDFNDNYNVNADLPNGVYIWQLIGKQNYYGKIIKQ